MEDASTSTRPNVLVILVDDMGFSDIGCYGSEIRTPNLDRLAGDGMRFSQMVNNARCCPTRASLLTGMCPQRAGVGHMIHDHGVGPAYQGFLRDDAATIGEHFRAGGYRTLYAGKWHASPGIPITGEPPVAPGEAGNPYPLSRGFDRFYGTLAGAGSFFYPHGLMDQERRIAAEDPDFYYTDAISENACDMIREAASADQPFLLHVCYTAPHWPLHAKPEDIERYRGRYDQGWDALRMERHEKLKQSGLLNPDWEISPRDEQSRDFHTDSAERQRWESLRMAVYAAQVDAMDQGVGRILDELDARGVAENTLVMFLSDNGGCAEFLAEDDPADPAKWSNRFRHMNRPGEIMRVGNSTAWNPGPADTFMSYDLPWANASNTPFRLYKHWVHEGGISTPMICRWPGVIEPGSMGHEPCHVMDILPSCLDAAGLPTLGDVNGNPVQPLEGVSFAPLLRGESNWRRGKPIFIEHEGNRAVRDGEWKLVSKTVKNCNGPWELYNMSEDRTELHDRMADEGQRAERMIKTYGEWAERSGVLPWDRGPKPME